MLHIVTDAYVAFFMCGACAAAGPSHPHAAAMFGPEGELSAAGLATVDAAYHVLDCSLLQEVSDG